MKMWKLGLFVAFAAAVLMGGTGVAFSQTASQARLVRGNEPARGRADAPVTVVVFCDFQCPYCSSMAPSFQRLATDYPVRVVYRNFPVQRIHPDAVRAAEAGACAQSGPSTGASTPTDIETMCDSTWRTAGRWA
ncbi:MAG: hypothetical protein DMF78_15810 [Acidobacteria bacterium]|nr:MAG: hypothetical protein DMF78_15810 [Acidobacteriota bacterium]